MPLGTASKACWPCRDRKIKCDRALPTCDKCEHSNRECLRLGTRLTWPTPRNQRRAIVGPPQAGKARLPMIANDWFVNISEADMLLRDRLHSGVPLNPRVRVALCPPLLKPVRWSGPDLAPQNDNLLSYFNHIAANLLTTVNDSFQCVPELLISMALIDGSTSSSSVFFALMAVSALFMQNPAQALSYRQRAKSMLDTVQLEGLEFHKALQQIAASMLLCLFDIHDKTQWTSSWVDQICYAKEVVNMMHMKGVNYQGDIAVLFDWVFYHDALARFSLRHWKPAAPDKEICRSNPLVQSKRLDSLLRSQIMCLIGCSLETLSAITAATNLVLASESPLPLTDAQQDQCRSLVQRLECAQQDVEDRVISAPDKHKIQSIAELYRLAGLIYLLRTNGQSSTLEDVELHVSSAFTILDTLDTCERAFPMFIIGCEARSDVERQRVLALFSRTQQHRYSGSLIVAQHMVERSWVQDDLYPEVAIDYTRKLNLIMSSYTFLPTFT